MVRNKKDRDASWIGIPNDISKYAGFIYCITNIKTGKTYIGKKVFFNEMARPPLKGRKNKRHYLKESDWRDYYGSSATLHLDLEKYGQNAFKRQIIRLCKSKWELSYYELIEQIEREVLFRDDSYNGIIQVRLPKAPKRLRTKRGIY